MMRQHRSFEMDWIPLTSKWSSNCQACGFGIQKYDPIYWNKVTKKVRHQKCLDLEYYKTFGQKQYWKGGRY